MLSQDDGLQRLQLALAAQDLVQGHLGEIQIVVWTFELIYASLGAGVCWLGWIGVGARSIATRSRVPLTLMLLAAHPKVTLVMVVSVSYTLVSRRHGAHLIEVLWAALRRLLQHIVGAHSLAGCKEAAAR